MAQGVDSYVQIGREAVYGVAAAATHRLSGFLTFNAKPSAAATLEDPSLDGSPFFAPADNIGVFVEWTLEGVLSYEGMNMLYDWIYGTDTFGAAGGTSVGGSPNVHTFLTRSKLNSYTIQGSFGDTPTGKVRRILGAKAERLSISVTAGGGDQSAMRYTLSGTGSLLQHTITPTGSVPVIARVPIFFTDLVTAASTDGSGDPVADQVFTSFGFEIENPTSNRRFQLGVSTLREPIRNGKVREAMTFTRDHITESILDARLNNTTLHPVMKFMRGVNYVQFEIPAGRVPADSYDSPIDGPDDLQTSYTIKAHKTTGSPDRQSLLIAANSQTNVDDAT